MVLLPLPGLWPHLQVLASPIVGLGATVGTMGLATPQTPSAL
jgi:hypothetical protein